MEKPGGFGVAVTPEFSTNVGSSSVYTPVGKLLKVVTLSVTRRMAPLGPKRLAIWLRGSPMPVMVTSRFPMPGAGGDAGGSPGGGGSGLLEPV